MKILSISLPKTVFFNFRYFPLSVAVKFPVLVSKNVLLKKTGGKVLIEAGVKTGLVKIGFGDLGIFDAKRSRAIWEVSGTVIFRGKANIGHGSRISVMKDATLDIGDKLLINAEASIVASKRITIGVDCGIAWDTLIMDTDFHDIRSDGVVLNPPSEITIGNHVWVTCGVKILKGCNIADNAIIGAYTVVTRSLDTANAIYAGNPVKLCRENVTWNY